MKSQKKGAERRAQPRFDVALPLRIGTDDFQFATDTKNLSSSGIYCSVDRFVPVMTKLSLKLRIPLIEKNRKVEKGVDCQAVVVRISPESAQAQSQPYQVGLFFTQIEDDDRQLINQYLRQAFFAGSN